MAELRPAPAEDPELLARVARELRVAPARLADLAPELVEAVWRRLQELHAAAAIDEMTGALRRAAGLAALVREVRRARRFNDRKFVVVFLDVDHLKAVNDSRGHAAGDEVLREVVAALRRRLRIYDLVIRWGGDEFVCSLPGAGLEAAARAIDGVRAELAARTSSTFTAGYAELGADGDAESVVARADADFYERRRRDRWGLSRQNLQAMSAHLSAYPTPTRVVLTTAPGAGRNPSSTT